MKRKIALLTALFALGGLIGCGSSTPSNTSRVQVVHVGCSTSPPHVIRSPKASRSTKKAVPTTKKSTSKTKKTTKSH
jgi:predicted component of type VI protein secretion system